jgi:hypothetical protein
MAASSAAASSTKVSIVACAAATSSPNFAELRFVGDGQQCHRVGPQQMPDLVGDGPAWCRCGQGPLGCLDSGDPRIERFTFGAQIVHDQTGVGHDGELSSPVCGAGR